jgi:hypothetical protein
MAVMTGVVRSILTAELDRGILDVGNRRLKV